MSGAFRLNNGKFLVTPGGFAVDSDCCCEEFVCSDCSSDMQVVFSSMTAANCQCEDFGTYSEKYTDIALNGTHTLAKVSTCTWEATVSDVIEETTYAPSTTCDPADEVATSTYYARIVLSYDDVAGWRLEVFSDPPADTVFIASNATEECPNGLLFTADGRGECPYSGTATVTEI